MKWTEVLSFADAVRDHEQTLARLREGFDVRTNTADKLVGAWKHTGLMLAQSNIEELRHADIVGAYDRLKRVEQMLETFSSDDLVEHELFQKLEAIAARKLADTIVRCCKGSPS